MKNSKVINWIKKQPICLDRKDNDSKFSMNNLKWFILSCLLIYPAVLVLLISFIDLEKGRNIFQVALELLKNGMNSSISVYLNYSFNLIKIVYVYCLLICIFISLIWIEILTEKNYNFRIIHISPKFLVSVSVLVYFICFFGKNQFVHIFKKIYTCFHLSKNYNFVAIIVFLTLILNIFSLIFSWLISDKKFKFIVYLKSKTYITINCITILIYILAINAHILQVITVVLIFILFFLSIIKDFNRVLLNCSFTALAGLISLQTYYSQPKKESSMIVSEIFYCIVIALYICEWIVKKSRMVNNFNADLSQDEEDAIKDIIRELFGGGLLGSVVILLIILVKVLIFKL